jgi:phage baseplate assembly protein W
MSMRDAITLHEPRIVVDDLTVEQVQVEGRLNLHISFTIPALNSSRNLVLPYYLPNSPNL